MFYSFYCTFKDSPLPVFSPLLSVVVVPCLTKLWVWQERRRRFLLNSDYSPVVNSWIRTISSKTISFYDTLVLRNASTHLPSFDLHISPRRWTDSTSQPYFNDNKTKIQLSDFYKIIHPEKPRPEARNSVTKFQVLSTIVHVLEYLRNIYFTVQC